MIKRRTEGEKTPKGAEEAKGKKEGGGCATISSRE